MIYITYGPFNTDKLTDMSLRFVVASVQSLHKDRPAFHKSKDSTCFYRHLSQYHLCHQSNYSSVPDSDFNETILNIARVPILAMN